MTNTARAAVPYVCPGLNGFDNILSEETRHPVAVVDVCPEEDFDSLCCRFVCENVTSWAICALCWSRRCPYTFIASAPPSLCPSHRLTVGMSTPDSMQRVANKCRKSWWVIRGISNNRHALVSDFSHSPTAQTKSCGR